MTVTPELLLFLAGKMGLCPTIGLESGRVLIMGAESHFTPHTNDAQFGRLVVWAAMNKVNFGIECSESPADVWYINPARKNFNEYLSVDHDSTPDSIRAAVVVAVCRALGWEEGK